MKAVEKTVKGKNYKLIIGTKETIALEKEIGANAPFCVRKEYL